MQASSGGDEESKSREEGEQLVQQLHSEIEKLKEQLDQVRT